MACALEFKILGPLEICVGEDRVRLVGRRQEAIAATLLLEAGRPVSVERLVDAVWDEDPPATARHQVRDLVTRLRRSLVTRGAPADLIATTRSGYALHVTDGQVDAQVFEGMVTAGRRDKADDPVAAAVQLRTALSLWRGPALAGLSSRALSGEAARLDEHRLGAWEECLAIELELGHHHSIISELAGFVRVHPYRERAVASLMIAFYRDGRQADALATYTALAGQLRAELGIEPGPELRRLHEAVLRSDPALSHAALSDAALPDPALPDTAPSAAEPVHRPGPAAGGRRPAAGAPARSVGHAPVPPAQLPPDLAGFVGRAAELTGLDALLAPTGEPPSTVRMAVISGPPGVGKTALAVHWAHRAADRFPDGQLYVNLRGFGPAGEPMEASQALGGFLEALGVAPLQSPATVDDRAGRYRSLLAGRRVLVVLDNARDATQVRPLLPGSPGCAALVTSRGPLPGLVAAEGAHPFLVDPLSRAEGIELLTRRLGEPRVRAEPTAVVQILTRCAGLPLALAVVSAQAATRLGLTLGSLADQLGAAPDELDAFATDDLATDLRSVLSWSYRALSAPAARLFRLLGLHPGPTVRTAAAASLAGVDVVGARRALAELALANLVVEGAPGRYTMHDLLHRYAAELAGGIETRAAQELAYRRMLDHYLHSGYSADRLLYPASPTVVPDPPLPGVSSEAFADPVEARTWLAAELPVLLAAIRTALDLGFDAHTWRLACTVATTLERHGRWHDLLVTERAALTAAGRLDDRAGQAVAHRILGRVHGRLGQHEEAGEHFRRAIEISTAIADRVGAGLARLGIACWYESRNRYQDACDQARQALDIHTAAGYRLGQARALNTIAWCQVRMGHPEQAIDPCRQAIDLQRRLGALHGEANTWDSLGYAQHHLGRHEQALTSYRRALLLYRQLGDRYFEAVALTHLGDTHHAAWDLPAAHHAWRAAVAILGELAHPDAQQVHAKLRLLDQPS